MPEQLLARGFIGAGDILINPFDHDTGLPTGWIKGGDASTFELQAASEILERTSRGRDTAGQVIASVARQSPATINITFAEINRHNLTLAFMGKAEVINVASGSVTSEDVTFKPGVAAVLAKQNIAAAGFALTSSDGATTYDANTYEVNYRLGLIFPLAGSSPLNTAIAAAPSTGLVLRSAYTHGAIGGTKIKGAVRPQLRCAIKFDGKNEADGRPALVDVWEAILTPQSGFNFLSDEWNDLQLSGRMVTPTGKDAPFEVDMPDYA